METYKITLNVNGKPVETLSDILPIEDRKLTILFIAKTPAPTSVDAGHYFQGRQGQMFWNKLKEYGILKARPNTFNDENLLENNFGLTDIVKVPKNFGDEPSEEEYKAGLKRIIQTIDKYRPKVIVFVYKKVLDKVLSLGFGQYFTTQYGFNPKAENLFKTKVFVFPMPGTPCTRFQSLQAMDELVKLLKN